MVDRDRFHARYGPWALIAGGTDRIGEFYACRLAEYGLNIVLLARRRGPLDTLAGQLVKTFGVEIRTAGIDLTQQLAPKRSRAPHRRD